MRYKGLFFRYIHPDLLLRSICLAAINGLEVCNVFYVFAVQARAGVVFSEAAFDRVPSLMDRGHIVACWIAFVDGLDVLFDGAHRPLRTLPTSGCGTIAVGWTHRKPLDDFPATGTGHVGLFPRLTCLGFDFFVAFGIESCQVLGLGLVVVTPSFVLFVVRHEVQHGACVVFGVGGGDVSQAVRCQSSIHQTLPRLPLLRHAQVWRTRWTFPIGWTRFDVAKVDTPSTQTEGFGRVHELSRTSSGHHQLLEPSLGRRLGRGSDLLACVFLVLCASLLFPLVAQAFAKVRLGLLDAHGATHPLAMVVGEEAPAQLLLAVRTKRDESEAAPHPVRARRRHMDRRHLAERLEASREELGRHVGRQTAHVDAHSFLQIRRHGSFVHARTAPRRRMAHLCHVQMNPGCTGSDLGVCGQVPAGTVHIHLGRDGPTSMIGTEGSRLGDRWMIIQINQHTDGNRNRPPWTCKHARSVASRRSRGFPRVFHTNGPPHMPSSPSS
eukprot:scaffold177_cov334-Pavlova_lutheri.AAC.75